MTSQSADPKIVKTLVEAIFENLSTFKALHLAYENLMPAQMISDGLSAPLHVMVRLGHLKSFERALSFHTPDVKL